MEASWTEYRRVHVWIITIICHMHEPEMLWSMVHMIQYIQYYHWSFRAYQLARDGTKRSK